MLQTSGIYGFAITKPIDLNGARLDPITTNFQEARKLARDEARFNLTAILHGQTLDHSKFLFRLEAVLSFIERLEVLITEPMDRERSDQGDYTKTLVSHRRHSGGGEVLPEDTFFPTSRAEFIRMAMARLSDQTFCAETGFDILFFKYVEAFRQRKPFIEVMWFLLFSGLEGFSRAITRDRGSDPSRPIYKLLKSYGFHVFQHKPADLVRSIWTYTQLRHALFHNGEREVLAKNGGGVAHLKMTDYLFHLEQLVALAILKAIGFDDGHVNWDSWVDRQPFK